MSVTEIGQGMYVESVPRAALLPRGWDVLCGTFLRSKAMLAHYERFNPCRQRYYCLYRKGYLTAGVIVYSRKQNLLTFLGNVPSAVPMNVVGIPASISPTGVWGPPHDAARLLSAVFERERGLSLALNLPESLPSVITSPAAHQVRMLPGMVFTNRFRTFGGYEDSLRSPWRRRLKTIRKKFEEVRTEREGAAAFTREHHALYLDVLDRAPEKMETLGFTFFRKLPAPIELVSCYRKGRLLCWRLMLAEDNRLLFLLGGHDYRLNPIYDAYFNNLVGVLADGIEMGVAHIDFGQTAEDPKARLGARPVPEKMLLRHSTPLWNRLLGAAKPLLAYRKAAPVYHVFRKEGAPGAYSFG